MSVTEKTGKTSHVITVSDRETVTLTGVKEVIAFDDAYVHLQTERGELTVDGSSLRIGVLDTARGEVTLAGQIDALTYRNGEGNRKSGLLGRLMH